jgi:hypothetical protein
MDWPDIWLLLVVVSTRWPPLAPKKESADSWLSPSVLSRLPQRLCDAETHGSRHSPEAGPAVLLQPAEWSGLPSGCR